MHNYISMDNLIIVGLVVAKRYQVITLTNIDLPLVEYCEFHIKRIKLEKVHENNPYKAFANYTFETISTSSRGPFY